MRWKARLAVAAGVIVVLCVGVSFQSRFVFFPEREHDATPSDVGLEFEDVWLTSGGNKIHGWLVRAKERETARGTVAFFHGNAGNISHRTRTIQHWAQLGFDVLIMDYQGYGRSEGKPSEDHTYEDAEAAWVYLTQQRGLEPSAIVVHGRSLGGAIATWLASQHEPAVLIIESTFTSVPDVAQDIYPFVGKWAVRIKYASIDRIGGITVPVLIAHGKGDDVIPYKHGQALFAAAPEPKRWLDLAGGHNGGWTLTPNYTETVSHFLAEHGFPE